ncbi:protachykinin-1-like isoform X1 [Synchiropus splendidus]|uniref:protachykinin-1-like isoform X1 n=1 Tax=Synchiropus splendidus TaxID=270530 RepID=UPI00237E93D5|nr:protachykinin-1-like isoform X1 [Synchiropus splendidus]
MFRWVRRRGDRGRTASVTDESQTPSGISCHHLGLLKTHTHHDALQVLETHLEKQALKLLVVLLVVLVQLLGVLGSHLSSEEEERDVWSSEKWQEHPLERRITVLADLLKRSKAQQFHGLMGRSPGETRQLRLGRKRNKGEMFVGLMGRRSLNEDTQEDWKYD